MKFVGLIFGLLIGITAIWISQRLVRVYFSMRSWEKVSAKVLSKEVFLDPRSTSVRSPYRVVVKYAYHFNNQPYQNDKVDLVEFIGGWSACTKADGEKRISKIEDEIEVYVDPADPSQSVIDRGGIFLYALVFLVGLIAIFLGLINFLSK